MKIKSIRHLLMFFLIVFSGVLFAQGRLENYKRAKQFLPGNIDKLTATMRVSPQWINKTSKFWYRNTLHEGKEFILVNPEKNTKERAFDHKKLADALSSESGKKYTEYDLPFNSFEFSNDEKYIEFDAGKDRYKCDLSDYKLEKVKKEERVRGKSPDGKWKTYVKDYNLYIESTESGESVQLTTDGIKKYGYASKPSWYELINIGKPEVEEKSRFANVSWSPDSKKLVTFRLDQRNAQYLYLMQYMPENSLRANVFAYERALPGDTLLSMVEFFLFDIESRKKTRIRIESYPTFLDNGNPDWSKDGKRLHYQRWYRGYQAVDYIEINPETGNVKTLIKERSDTYVDLYFIRPHLVKDGEEILWTSERDGYNHIYLYDGKTGKLKNQVTKGEFVVRNITHIDEKKHRVYFEAGAKEKNRDPYFRHLYRVNFDGSGLRLLTEEDAEHEISFSPDGKYFVDNYSRVDMPPESVLKRSENGKLIQKLEKADISKLLETGWKFPERFCVKGRDGKTDIYGVIFRPSDFDPSKKYPVIDGTYSGPQAVRTPKSFYRGYSNQDMPLAELGFIVVTIDGMGTAMRSKAFHDVSHRDLGDIGSDDHITVLKQLAEKYPYMDLSRVGIYGHSAGGYDAAHAILTRPDFYKVAVASAGNHDHRMAKVWWPEFYMGYPAGKHYEEQSNLTIAKNLQGKLLLAHGDMDNNVNTACTMRLAGELIKANKDFDLLIVPNATHGLSRDRYFIRKRWDYFVKHLLNVEPPKEYDIREKEEG
ncbi:DPP IV N-terminal domain-containing protein [candidate division KSB1 bacterium]